MAVVGASGGLGSAVTGQLLENGATVLLAGPHIDRLSTLEGPRSTSVELDLRDPRAGDHLAALAMERHGRLDGMINAAGVVAFGPLLETDDTVIEELFLTNVIGPLWLLKRLIPLLADSGGFVVNLSAVVAERPLAQMATYSATKAAITAADRALARELRRMRIDVCDVRPPHAETGLAQRPLAGVAPELPGGLPPERVASVVIDAILSGRSEVPSEGFGPVDADGAGDGRRED